MNLRRKLGLLWQWSPIVTLPVALLFFSWAAATWDQFRAFGLEYDSAPASVRLRDVGIDQWNLLVRRAELQATGATLTDVPEQHALNTVQLFLEGDQQAALDSDLPYSGYEFRKGKLMFRDGLHDVKIRYRGDFLVHWAYDKKSIRVKTETTELFEGMRAFNLIVPKFPEQVNNYLGYRLAREMGIMSPRCELVNVTVNGQNRGLHEFTEQLDEGTLRSWDKMPGDLYSGDLISKTWVMGSNNRVFELPMLWDKIAANNHYDLDSRAPLERLLELLNSDLSEANQEALSKLIDMQAFGAFGAFEVLTQTHHYDEYHNWRLFWDPWALKFRPVVWDPIAWAPDMRPMPGRQPDEDLVLTRLHVWLYRNGDFLAERHRALRDFFESGRCEQFTAEVDWTLAAAAAASRLDPNARPTDPDEITAGMRQFRSYYGDLMRFLRNAHLDTPGKVTYVAPDGTGRMPIEVSGRQPVDEIVLHFRNPVTQAVGASLNTRRGSERIEVDLDGGVTVQGNDVRIPARMFAQLEPRFVFGWILRQHSLIDVPTYYELQLRNLPTDNPLAAVGIVRAGRPDRALPVASITPGDAWWLYRACPAQPVRRPQIWSGEVVVDGLREIHDDVVIEAGTTVRMKADASVVFRGRVSAIGTAEQPIRIVPFRDEQEPWGTFSINDPNCTGSTFRFVKMRGGSGFKTPVEEYSAMFSIHNCRDIRVEDCRFADNLVVDDMIHVMYGEVLFDRVELIKARADALDCDISRVVIRNSRFVESDNDGVDLMTTLALVHDCQFLRNGDKGISIGEGTKLIGVRNSFDGCVKAMEAKDGSIARTVNCEIRNCERALNAYRKNWRYDGGGDLEVHKSAFVGNKVMPTADASSRVVLIDCRVDKDITPTYSESSKIRRNHASQVNCGPGSATTPTMRQPLPFPADLPELEAMCQSVWATARTDIRGGGRDD